MAIGSDNLDCCTEPTHLRRSPLVPSPHSTSPHALRPLWDGNLQPFPLALVSCLPRPQRLGVLHDCHLQNMVQKHVEWHRITDTDLTGVMVMDCINHDSDGLYLCTADNHDCPARVSCQVRQIIDAVCSDLRT
jgi:hypothetical protein